MLQEPLEQLLEEEELWRNGRRLDQLYVGPSHPICPDLYDLGSRAELEPGVEHKVPIDPELTGAPCSSAQQRTQHHPHPPPRLNQLPDGVKLSPVTGADAALVQVGWSASCWPPAGRCAPWW